MACAEGELVTHRTRNHAGACWLQYLGVPPDNTLRSCWAPSKPVLSLSKGMSGAT